MRLRSESVALNKGSTLCGRAARCRTWHQSQRQMISALVALCFFVHTSAALACGPESIEPIFVFVGSPDLPFTDFAAGRIGIVRPTFGRKTLVVSYRYLNGGAFTSDEQQGIVEALKGKAPEADNDEALGAWLEARKAVAGEEKELPAVYRKGLSGGYDFFRIASVTLSKSQRKH